MFCHVLSDLGLLDSTIPTNVYNDNHGSVDWSNSFSTKGMRHVNILLHIPGTANPVDLFIKEFKSDFTF